VNWSRNRKMNTSPSRRELARDTQRRHAIAAGLPRSDARFATDGCQGFVRSLEQAYRAMVERV